MGLFRRRKAGKHQLGAAVTAIPSLSLPVQPVRPASAPLLPPAAAAYAAPALPVPAAAPPPAPVATPEPPASPPVQAVEITAPRVELGFRDGSTAALAPGSPQALALEEIAATLTRRD